MAQTGYVPISLYYSTTAATAPTAANLVSGELAINITDGILFYKDNAGVVQTLATKAATSGSYTSITLTGGTANGIAYLNGSKAVTTGTALQFDGATLGVGVTPQTWWATRKALQVGTLAALASDTSTTAFTSNIYNDAGGTATYLTTTYATAYYQSGGQHYWYTAPSGTAGTAITLTQRMGLDNSGNLTLNAGTANGVAYLNGSKVLTTGTALTFDGTSLSPDGTSRNLGTSSLRWGTVYATALADGTDQLVGSSGITVRWGFGSSWGSQAFAIAGSEQMRLTSTGLGIGTSSPGYKLDVSGTARATAANNNAMILQSGASGSYTSLALGRASAEIYFSIAAAANNFITGSAAGDLTLNNNTGNVLITAGGSSTQFYLNTSGNLGLGVTPSAWVSSVKAFDVGSAAASYYSGGVTHNAYFDATDSRWEYKGTGPATFYNVQGGTHAWSIAASGTAGNAITFTQAMTLNASGNLGIGTSSPAFKLHVGGAGSQFALISTTDTTSTTGVLFGDSASNTVGRIEYVHSDNGMRFFTNGTTQATLDSSGNFGLGVTPSAWGSSFRAYQNGGAAGALNFSGSSASGLVSVNAYNNGTSWLYQNNGVASRLDYNYTAGGSWAWNIAGAGTAGNAISFTQAMTLDASSNLMIGTTSAAQRLTVFKGISANNSADAGIAIVRFGSTYGSNLYHTYSTTTSTEAFGLTVNENTTLTDAQYTKYLVGSNGVHIWYGATTASERARIDSSGNLLVGATSSAVGYGGKGFTVYNPTFPEIKLIDSDTGGSSTDGTSLALSALDFIINNRESANIIFSTNNTERARITSGGYSKFSNDGTYVLSTGSYHEFRQTANNLGLYVTSTNASLTTDGIILAEAARNTTNNSFYALSYYNSGAGAYKWRVADSGNVTNTNGSYGTISDAKMKTDIVDAGSQWSDIKAIRFRKFKMKDDPEQRVQLGVVAQELEQTSPGLVEEHADRDAEGNDLGTVTKSVKTSILLMKAAVALQEAMARIEQLETRVAQLEGK